MFIYKLIDYLRVKHAKEQYQAVLYDHIENRDASTIHAKVDSRDDYPIDIMFCDQCDEEKEATTAEGTCNVIEVHFRLYSISSAPFVSELRLFESWREIWAEKSFTLFLVIFSEIYLF